MKKYSVWVIALLLISISASAQKTTYPFDVKKTGNGKQAIIFIPGFTCSGDVWNETMAKLGDNYTYYTLTMAGFAGVPAQPNANVTNWVQGIARFIKDKKIEKPVIVGHSMGGGFAMAIAAEYPDLVSKIVVVDALPCLKALMNPDFKPVDCTPIIKQITGLNNEQFMQMQKMSVSQLVADTSKRQMIANWSISSDRNTFAQMFCDFTNTDLRQTIAGVKCPVLILLESGFVAYKPAIEDQYKRLKTADLEYATKGLHFIMYDDFDWYFNKLNSFLAAK